MGTFAKFAGDWEQRLAAQQAQMETVIPSTEKETALKALAQLQALRQKAFDMGYGMRASSQQNPLQELLSEVGGGTSGAGIPTREMAISVPATKSGSEKAALLGPVIDPLKHALQATRVELSRAADEKLTEGRRVTEDPSTLPWYYPSMALSAPKSFAEGYQHADKVQHDGIHKDLDQKIQLAREQFEKALKDEYQHGRKTASAGELIDGLAIKSAAGELNNAAGIYLALASLMGQGAYHQSKRWTEDHDPRTIQMKAVKDLIRQRMRSQPPALRVGSSDDSMAIPPPALETAAV